MKKLITAAMLAAFTFFHASVFAQGKIDKKLSPIEVGKVVGNKIVNSTPFAFNLVVQPAPEKFDFIKYVDFGRTYDLDKPAVAYALSELVVAKDTTLGLEMSYNDGVKVWLNGKVILEDNRLGEAEITPRERDILMQKKITVELKKGRNKVLVKSANSGKAKKWIFYFQPTGGLEWASPIKNVDLTIKNIEGVDAKVAEIANWLVIGTFPNSVAGGKHSGMSKSYAPESEFVIGSLYTDGGKEIAWGIPKVELNVGFIDAHPKWGTYYTYNYHAAGVAWAMDNLGEIAGEKKFEDFAGKYCDFIMEKKPYIGFQVNTLNAYRGAQHHMYHTPLLDFTSAPCMPFIYRVRNGKPLAKQEEAEAFVKEIKTYLDKKQVRLDDGTFTRETPVKYTTWVDDMFMGIPFVVQAALHGKQLGDADKWFDEAANQVIGFRKQVWDPEANLFMHAQYSETKVNIPHWGRANGWGIWATSEVLMHLPKNHKKYKEILKGYQAHVKALTALQTEGGLWHNVVDDKSSYLETSGTAIFVMAIARGINNGWLKRKDYEQVVLKGWEALKGQIDADGTVHGICMGTMSSEDVNYYKSRPVVDNDSHGMIGLIFASIEVQKMLDGKK